MDDKIFVRIEYNELEGELHYEQDLESEQGDNGYSTVAEGIDSDLAFEFGEIIDTKYPDLGEGGEGKNPSLEQIKTEFQNFIVDKKSDLT